jgi:hypothetical protein
MGQIGSYSRYGAFIIGGVLGLGMELNDQGRCLDEDVENCDELEIQISDTEKASLFHPFHPVVLEFTFELGVAF